MSKIFDSTVSKSGIYLSGKYTNTSEPKIHFSAKELFDSGRYYNVHQRVLEITIEGFQVIGLLECCSYIDVNQQIEENKEKLSIGLNGTFKLIPAYYKLQFMSGYSTHHQILIFNINDIIFREITGDDKFEKLSLPNEFKQFIVNTQAYYASYDLKKDHFYSFNNINLGSYISTESIKFVDGYDNMYFPILIFNKNNQVYKLILPLMETPAKYFKVRIIKFEV
jgi:hypothetical protein